MHIRNLKQALNHGQVFEKVNRDIKFNYKFWLKPYIDTITAFRKKQNMTLRMKF